MFVFWSPEFSNFYVFFKKKIIFGRTCYGTTVFPMTHSLWRKRCRLRQHRNSPEFIATSQGFAFARKSFHAVNWGRTFRNVLSSPEVYSLLTTRDGVRTTHLKNRRKVFRGCLNTFKLNNLAGLKCEAKRQTVELSALCELLCEFGDKCNMIPIGRVRA